MAECDDAVELGRLFAAHHGERSLEQLLLWLGIERSDPDWQARLAPFATVWASMIVAGAIGHQTVAKEQGADPTPTM